MKKSTITKITGLLVLSAVVLLAGCTSNKTGYVEKTPGGGTATGGTTQPAPFDKTLTAIKVQIADDLKEGGVSEEEVMVDGKLTYFFETDLKASEESDSAVPIWIENLDVDVEELEKGVVISPMMNVNSDQVILFEAKDEKDVESLRGSLEKALEAQDQTWSQYLPDQYAKVKKNRIKTNGKFLLYVTYESPEKIEKIFDTNLK